MTSTRKRNRAEISNQHNKENEPAPKAMRLNNNSRLEISGNKKKDGDMVWACKVCTFENKYDAIKCDICERPKDIDNDIDNLLCSKCNKEYGYDLDSCKHKLCIACCYKWILDGIKKSKWLNQLICCPSCNNNKSSIPSYLIKQCKFTDEENKKLHAQESFYMIKLSKLCISDGCQETGEEIGNCHHNLCNQCCKKYLLKGIVTNKWKKQSICCPVNQCDIILSNRIISKCGISLNMKNKIELMQNEYIRLDPTIIECPKCKETYSSEHGDIDCENKNQSLSLIHKKHKTKYRFRCSKVR